MKNNIISVYCKNYIDIIDINKVIATSYNKINKIFSIYLEDYEFSYNILDFKDKYQFINTINKINRAIREYKEKKICLKNMEV